MESTLFKEPSDEHIDILIMKNHLLALRNHVEKSLKFPEFVQDIDYVIMNVDSMYMNCKCWFYPFELRKHCVDYFASKAKSL